MPLEIRAGLGVDSQDRRYADEGKNRLPEDVADPTTVRDDSTPTLRERVLQYRWFFLAVTSLVVVLVMYSIAVGATILPDLLNNPWLRAIASHGILVVLAYVVGAKLAYSRIRDIDWLVLDKKGSPGFYPGWYEPADDDEGYAKFAPCKGFTLFGHRSKPLELGEVNPDIARKLSATNRDLSDPAVIRLDPEYGSVRSTEYGNVLVQISDGLEVDTFASTNQVLKATLPSMADADRVELLHRTIESLRDDKQHYEQLAEKYATQRDRIAESLSEPLDEIIDKSIERGERIAKAGRSRDWEDYGGEEIPPGDQVVEQIDREVAGDGYEN